MCKRIHRRTFLELGLGSALAAGVGLPLWARRARAERPAGATASACILLYMEGGPSHIDTWDPKPGAPGAGEIKPIPTALTGVAVSEHLPELARRMKRLALVRSLTSTEGNHARARYLMHTGYPPQGGVDHPALGALVAEARPPKEMPGYVVIGGPGEDAGFLGAAFSPFPVPDPARPVRYLSPAPGIDAERFQERVRLWRGFQDRFARGRSSPQIDGGRRVGESALQLMRSPGAEAFVLDDEPARIRQAYGESSFGKGCLMARRLVEAGVPFVEVALRGWDTHQENFPRVKALSRELDQGMSALLDDLDSRGLLSSTLVLWLGDFGRTPWINARGGRDHYPRCGAAVLAGGGIQGGQVLGATDDRGAEVKDRPVTVPDLFRTVATAMGLAPDRARMSPAGRPIKTVDGGQVIRELL